MADLAAERERVTDLSSLAVGVGLAALDASRWDAAAGIARRLCSLADSTSLALSRVVASGARQCALGAATARLAVV